METDPEARRSDISEAFVEQQRPLRAFISRFIRGPQDIDDIAQETFVRAFPSLNFHTSRFAYQ